MIDIYAFIACIILACLGIFQLALVFGAPIGKYAWGGSHTVLPVRLRIGSVISVILYLLFSIIVLNKAGVVSMVSSERVTNISIWVVTIYFFIGVIMNGISRSKHERMIMTPIALTLAVLFLLVALG